MGGANKKKRTCVEFLVPGDGDTAVCVSADVYKLREFGWGRRGKRWGPFFVVLAETDQRTVRIATNKENIAKSGVDGVPIYYAPSGSNRRERLCLARPEKMPVERRYWGPLIILSTERNSEGKIISVNVDLNTMFY